MRYCLNYSGTRCLPLKIEITQFPDGLLLNITITKFYNNLTTAKIIKIKTLFHEDIQK